MSQKSKDHPPCRAGAFEHGMYVFHEAFAPSREYPWDCMVEHIFTGTLLPFLCLLGYLLYVFLCACIPVYRKVWKGIGFFVLGGMSLAFEYVNVFFPVALLAGYLFRFTISGNSGITFPWSGNVTGFLP